MKKKRSFYLFALLTALLLPLAGNAQDELTTCRGDNTMIAQAPFYTYWGDIRFRNEYIIPADSLVDLIGSQITGLSFRLRPYSSGTVNTQTYTFSNIKVMASETSSLTTGSQWICDTVQDLVFVGSIVLNGSTMSFEFDTPYIYSGSNLVLQFYHPVSGGQYLTSGYYWYGCTATANCVAYSSNSYVNAPSSTMSYLPECTFSYVAGGSICRTVASPAVDNIIDGEATLSWIPRGEETSWAVYLNGEQTAIVSDTFYTFSGLDNNSLYTASVRAICGVDDTSRAVSVSFHTPCVALTQAEDLPYTENFNSYTSMQPAIDPCWQKLNSVSGNDYPFPNANWDRATGNALYFYSGTNQYNYAILPPFDDLNGLLVTFYARCNSGAQMQVGVMSNPSDASTFTPIYTTPATSSDWFFHEALIPANTTANYIAFRNQGSSNTGSAIDDIVVMLAPDCMHAASAEISDVSATSATLTINDPTQVGNYLIDIVYGTDTTHLTSSSTVVSLTDLNPSSAYTVIVTSVCSDGSLTTSVSTSFRTSCSTITYLPWTEDFSTFTATAGAETSSAIYNLPCWNTYQADAHYSFIQNSWNHGGTGANAIRIYAGNSYPTYMVLPEFEEPIDNLMFSFWANFDNTNLHMELGYMTDGSQTSTFVPVDTIYGTTLNDWVYYEVFFPAGATGRIAYRFYGSGSNNVRLDDFTVMIAPSCARPNSVSITSVSTNEATAQVVDNTATESHFYILYRGTTAVDSGSFDGQELNLSNLIASSSYTLSVMSICDDGTRTAPVLAYFNTLCAETPLPYTEGFETYATDAVPNCWNHLNPVSSGNNYIGVYNSTANNGSRALRFNYSSSTGSVITLPVFESEISQLEMSFYHRPESSSNSNCGTFYVGYLTNPIDIASFVAVQSWSYSDMPSSAYLQSEVTFPNAPDGSVIAFRHVANGYNWYWHLDDVDVHPIPACTRPTITITSTTDEGAIVNLADVNDLNNYILTLPDGTTVTLNGENTYTLSNLTPTTTYTVSAVTICDDGSNSATTSATFTTTCTLESFPFHFTQTDMYNVQSPGFSSCWDWIEFYRSSTGGIGYVYSYNPISEFRLPAVDVDLSTAQLRTLVSTTSDNCRFRVGVRDGETTTWIDTVSVERTASATEGIEYVVYLSRYTGNGKRVVVGNLGSTNIYHLDFHIEPIETCMTPVDVAFSEIISDSATLSWSSPDEDSHTYLAFLNGNPVGTTTDTFYTFSSLSANTQYSVSVAILCSQSDTSRLISRTFTTPCTMLTSSDLPLFEDFESLPGSASIVIPCWRSFGLGTSYPSWPHTSTSTGPENEGSQVCYFYSDANAPEYLIAPPIDNLSGLIASCYVSQISSGVGVTIGVMVDPDDDATFTPLQTFTPSARVWEYCEVNLSSYTGSGHYVAYRICPASSGGVYVDNVFIGVAPACPAPVSINITDIEVNIATLHIVDTANVGNYHVVLLEGTDTVLDAVTSDTVYTLNTILPASVYSVYVFTECSDGSHTRQRNASFRTPCGNGISTFPYTQGFESEEAPAPCWNLVYGDNNPSVNTMIHSTSKHSEGLRAFRFSSYASSQDYNQYLISPEFNATDSLTVSFDYAATNANNDEYLRVGYSTTTIDTSAFTWVEMLDVRLTTWETYIHTFPQDAKYIAIHYYANYRHYVDIDNFRVESAGSNPQPVQYTVSANSANTSMGTATVSPSGLVDAGTQVTATATALPGYEFSAWMEGTTQVSTDNPYTFTLTANTSLTATFVPSVSLSEASESSILLSPNPAESIVNISGLSGLASVSIVDASGRTVFSTSAEESISIDVSTFAKGAYFVKILSDQHTSVHKLIVK